MVFLYILSRTFVDHRDHQNDRCLRYVILILYKRKEKQDVSGEKAYCIYGHVQGVGFRYTAKYLAQSMGLTGWVVNEYDGTVVMEVQGSEALINKLLVGN